MNTWSLEIGAAIVRIALGSVVLAHSLYLKMFIYTLPGTAQFFASIGLPASSAYVVFALEVLAGVALILGFRTRLAAAALIPILLGATWAHAGHGWLFTNQGGGWEYPLFLALIAIGQVFLGDGKFAVSSLRSSALAVGSKA